VISGKGSISTASLVIEWEGVCHSATAEGNGPVDASFTAVKQIVKKKVRLEEFLIQAIHRGSNDLGKVHVKVESKGQIYYGFSASTDIITASVEAFLDALSQTV
jgi:2-isopropylmalate synthase